VTREDSASLPDDRLPAVLDLLKGADEETVARRYNVRAEDLRLWKDRFLLAGTTALRDEHPIFALWKSSLRDLLGRYDRIRAARRRFMPWLFLFFLAVNLACYWLGVFTAFPELLAQGDWTYYFKIQFPVGLLGALFDTLSFYVTVYIVRQALRTTSARSYIAHLSVDLLIAAVATAWVLFVFWISGWVVSLTESDPQTLAERAEKYEEVIVGAVTKPLASFRNIYFGIVMGFSTLIPTAVHLFMSLRAIVRHIRGAAPAPVTSGKKL
jgi:hypothetical protein